MGALPIASGNVIKSFRVSDSDAEQVHLNGSRCCDRFSVFRRIARLEIIAAPAGKTHVFGAKRLADALFGVVWVMNREGQPPSAVVKPQVMIGPIRVSAGRYSYFIHGAFVCVSGLGCAVSRRLLALPVTGP